MSTIPTMSTLPALPTLDDLTQLGRYQLTRVLGRGAMGVVYEGQDPKLNRQVAVKIILQNFADDHSLKAEYSARFVREAQAVARLSHANIVTVFDFGEENDVMYIVMEYIHGAELKDSFDQHRRFSLPDVVRMTGELLDALDYAHNKGVVHRDIKPANVMLDAQMHVQLTDFGVARLADSGNERTMVGTMVGTPSYMSPEQIAGVAVGPRSDLFAVGIILYQFLTDQKPFQATGTFAIQQKIMLEDPELPSKLNHAVSNAFDCVVFRALAKRPEDRYPSARAFKEDLQRALAGEQLHEGNTLPFTTKQSQPLMDIEELTRLQQSNHAALSQDTVSAGLELEFWRAMKDSPDAEEFQLYLKRYPQGVYAELAQRKLARLLGEISLPSSDTGTTQPSITPATSTPPLLPIALQEATPSLPAPAPAIATAAAPVTAQTLMPEPTTKPTSSATPAQQRQPTPTSPPVAAQPFIVPPSPSPPRKTRLLPILGLLAIGLIGCLYFVLSSNLPKRADTTDTQPGLAPFSGNVSSASAKPPPPIQVPTVSNSAVAPANPSDDKSPAAMNDTEEAKKAELLNEQKKLQEIEQKRKARVTAQKTENDGLRRIQEEAERQRLLELRDKEERERKRREDLAAEFKRRIENQR